MDEPAFPHEDGQYQGENDAGSHGMTKLEYAAIEAMKGFVTFFGVVGGVGPTEQAIARYSVDQAEALLAELEARKRGNGDE